MTLLPAIEDMVDRYRRRRFVTPPPFLVPRRHLHRAQEFFGPGVDVRPFADAPGLPSPRVTWLRPHDPPGRRSGHGRHQ